MFGISDSRATVCDVDVDAGAPRHVVEHDRQPRALGDGLEVLVQPFLRRLVVIRRHRQQAVDASLLHVARQLDHLARVVAAGAGQHRHLAADFLDDQLDDAQLLAMAQRRRFARRAARRQEVDAGIDLPAGQPLDRRLVERAVLPERRDEGRADAGEWSAHGG